MTFCPLVVFADIHEQQFLAGIDTCFHIGNICFFDALLGVLYQFQKLLGMRHIILPRRNNPSRKPSTSVASAWRRYGFAVVPAAFCAEPLAAKDRTKLTRFQRSFSG